MINAIKMELYKVKKFKSTWILLLVLIAVMMFSVFINKIMLDMFKNEDFYESYQQAMEQTEDTQSVGITVSSDSDEDIINKYLEDGSISFSGLFDTAISGNFLIFILSMFCLFFMNSEIKNGYIKNISGLFSSRSVLVFSKLFMVALYSLAAIVLSFGTILLGSKVFFPNVIFDDWSSVIKIMLIKYLLFVALGSMIMLIVQFLRNTAGSAVLTMAVVLGVTGFILSLINSLLKYLDIVNDKFDLTNYTVTGNFSQVTTSSSNGDIIRACIVGAIFLIVTMVSSVAVVSKKDIK